MRFDAIAVYDGLLNEKIITASSHRSIVDKLRTKQDFAPDDVFFHALSQSISDVIRVAASRGYDEEHVTASLSGALTANLTWFAKAFRNIGGVETRSPKGSGAPISS